MSQADAVPPRAYEPAAAAPLDGVRILDLSRLVSGNMVTHVLADLGADVVKLERPGAGDDLRNWQTDGVSLHWKVYARNKRSATLDVRSAAGRDLLLRLVERADALVENFRPGTLEGWGLGPDVLLARNPKLVVLRVSGWGQDGPYRHKPGYGSLVEGMSGFAAMNGFPDKPPALPPTALADMVAGLYGACALMVALRAVEVGGGDGQVIDLPLFDPIFASLGPQAAIHAVSGRVPRRQGNRSELTAPRNVYRCSDGAYVALSASMQGMAERLFRTIGRPELIDDPRFRTNELRVRNNDALDPIVAQFIAARSQAENLALFEEAGVTVGPVCDIAELVDHPYVRGREVLVDYADDDIGRLPMHNVIPRLGRTPGAIRLPAPALGAHNAEVYGELGLDADALAALQSDGVI